QVAVDPAGHAGEITINFTGDAFMGRSYDQPGGLIDTHGVEYLWEPTRAILGLAADVTVINAECAFTDRGTPHPTKSVVFRTRPGNIAGLLYAGVDVATLGNNHIIDYGLEGMLQTHEVFDSAGIVRAGSGVDDYSALQPAYHTCQGVRLAIYSACNRTGRQYNEQPFFDAAAGKYGLAYWLEPNNLRALAQADTLADIVIACPHSGIEYDLSVPEGDGDPPALFAGDPPARFDIENGPPFTPEALAPDVRFRIWPGLADRALRQQAIDFGADAVINNHPHVLQAFESYQGKLIAHSLGNFMFDLSYAETLPTLVLTARAGKEGILGWSCAPVFIDRLIPRPATGRLGREILDRQADWSRPYGALVGVDPQAASARIYLDPGQCYPQVAAHAAGSPWLERQGAFVTRPLALEGEGSLSRLASVEGAGPGAQVRLGREVLWFGRFEPDEGYRMWNLNSSDEWLDEETVYEGRYSLVLHRHASNSGNVTTLLDRHIPAADSLCYGLTGWMKTDNAAGAEFSVRLYTSRYNWTPLASLAMGEAIGGTSDWSWYAADFDAVPGGRYFNVRCNLDRPASGDAYAWFDDLRVIEWQPWQALAAPLDVPHPNNYRFVQLRTEAPGDSAVVVYEETSLADALFSAAPPVRPPAAPRARLLGARPNPVRTTALIAYDLAEAARVELAVHDVSGRLVTRLARGELQPAGRHAVEWRPERLASGLYFVRLKAGGDHLAGKLILLR
ncbi:MAG: CapA family protein, partial [Candidatus Eisenbacteria bacterium]|nr:CapA family protein [Candidatus Eisenbacteria bacterium]